MLNSLYAKIKYSLSGNPQHSQRQQVPLISYRSITPNKVSHFYITGLPSVKMRSQEWRVPHSKPMMKTLYSRPTLHTTGSISPLHEWLQDSSRVIVNKPPRVLHSYQLGQPSNRLELDPLAKNPSRARRVKLAEQDLSQLLRLHLVGNVIPQFLPPLMLGYLLWDLSPISEIFKLK